MARDHGAIVTALHPHDLMFAVKDAKRCMSGPEQLLCRMIIVDGIGHGPGRVQGEDFLVDLDTLQLIRWRKCGEMVKLRVAWRGLRWVINVEAALY